MKVGKVLAFFALALVGDSILFYTLRVDLLNSSIFFLIAFLLVLLVLISFSNFFSLYIERKTLKELKNEITWEKQGFIIEGEDILTRIFANNLTFFLLVFLFFSIFLLLISGKDVDSFSFPTFVMNLRHSSLSQNIIDENSEIVTDEKKFSSKNFSISAVYYTGGIPLNDLNEILNEEKTKMERILNVPLGRITIDLDHEKKICRREDAIACYYNGKIFVVPRNMMSREYVRRIIRHELIHHAEEEIANKYEMNEINFDKENIN